MTDIINVERPFMVVKKLHIVLALVLALMGVGLQAGLLIARTDISNRMDLFESRMVETEVFRKEVQLLSVETAKLRTEIEGLRRDLERKQQ